MATYHVSTNGNNQNPGTSAQPWRNIQHGVNQLKAGDTLIVHGGTYVETVNISVSGTADNPIVIRAAEGESPEVDGRAGVESKNSGLPTGPFSSCVPDDAPTNQGYCHHDIPMVHVRSSSNIVWDGIDIKRGLGRGFQASTLDAHSDNVTVKNCKIYGHRATGVQAWYNTNFTIDNCEIFDNANFAPFSRGGSYLNWPGAISGKGCSFITIKNCVIHDNWGEQTIFDANDGGSHDVTIQDCIYYDNFAGLGLHAVKNVTLERCYFYRSTTDKNTPSPFAKGPTEQIILTPAEQSWMEQISTENVTIRNNIVVDGWTSVALRGGASDKPIANALIANNTFVNSHPKGPGSVYAWAVNKSDIRIRNNIIYNVNGAKLVDDAGGRTNSGYTYSNNYWSSAPPNNILHDTATDVINGSSPFIDVNFAPDKGQGDANKYKLVDSAGAVNKAADLGTLEGFRDDYFRSLRNGSWDIGGHELNGSGGEAGFITADFSASPVEGQPPLTVTFQDKSTSSAPVTEWLWDFGDGGVSSTQNPTHTYQEGTYTVSLKVTSAAGTDTSIREGLIRVTSQESGTTGRITEDQVVLYRFNAGSGTLVEDVSGVGAPLNLNIGNTGGAAWLPDGGLSVTAATKISSDQPAAKLTDACRQSNEITVEAWIKPSNVTQEGPARVVSISNDTTNRNFTLGQGLWGDQPSDVFDFRLRTTNTDNNGAPSVTTPAGTATTELQHVVYTRTAQGDVSVYINGAQVAVARVMGDFSNWNSSYPFLLGDERTDGRPWLGSYYLVAVFSRALNAVEVKQNFDSGFDEPEVAVEAAFTISEGQAAGEAPHTVNFDSSASSSTNGITAYAWDFGDGGTSDEANPTHTYQEAGDYTVSLTVTDASGETDTLTEANYISVSPASGRIRDGLVAYYTFHEGTGRVIRDLSKFGDPLNLEIIDTAAVTWLDDGIEITAPAAIASTDTADKIVRACQETQEISLEAWVKPANATQDGPARIVSISKNFDERDITLAQGLWGSQPSNVYDVRIRTQGSSQDLNGFPSLTTPAGSLKVRLSHVVFTRDSAGNATIYIDGGMYVSKPRSGDFSNWENFGLYLANEAIGERPWLGSMHLVALYNRALTQAEIIRNFDAGLPEPGDDEEYEPIIPDTFRRFALTRPGYNPDENPAGLLAYGAQYPDMRCIILWEGESSFMEYANINAVEEAYPEATFYWVDEAEE